MDDKLLIRWLPLLLLALCLPLAGQSLLRRRRRPHLSPADLAQSAGPKQSQSPVPFWPSSIPHIQLIVHATLSDSESFRSISSNMPISRRMHQSPVKGRQPRQGRSHQPPKGRSVNRQKVANKQRRAQKTAAAVVEEQAKADWANLVLGQLLGEEANRVGREMADRMAEKTTTGWQLFSLGSGAFVRVSGPRNRVDAKRRSAANHELGEECDTLFLPQPVDQGDWTGRGQLLLKHARTGRFLCLGRRRGVVTRLHPGRGGFCHFRELLAPSGRLQLLSRRPLGFGPSGRPLTHRRLPSTGRPAAQRCFQFTKLQSQMPAASGDFCAGPRPRRVRADADQQAQLREMARQALLAQIEATDERNGAVEEPGMEQAKEEGSGQDEDNNGI